MAYQTQVFSGGGRVFVATKHIPTKLHTQVVIDGTIIDISEYQIINNSLVLNEETEEDVVLKISDNPNEFDDIVIQTTTKGVWGEIIGDMIDQEDLVTFLQDNYEIKTNIKNGINSNTPRDVVTISRDNTTRTITLTPVLAEGYSFCSNDVEYTITETLTIQFSDVQGNYYIYFDEAGILQTTNNFNDDLLTKYALVDIGYWSVSKQKSLNNYEFHTSQISGLWHKQQHETVGAIYAYGFTEVAQNPPQAFNGSSDDDIRVQITSGKMWDEDLPHILGTKALDEDVTLLYRVGFDWEWTNQADSVYNISNVPQWDNEGTMTSHTDGYYGVAIFYKAPFINDPETICVMSQNEYATIEEASEACRQRPDITGMPIPEFRALFSKPYKYSSIYTNDSRCTFVPLDDGTDKVLWYWKTGIENVGGDSVGTQTSQDVVDNETYSSITKTENTQKGVNKGINTELGKTKTRIAKMTATQASTVIELVNVTELVLSVEANSVYEVDCFVIFQSNTSTANGIKLGYVSPSDCLCTLEISIPTTTAVATAPYSGKYPSSNIYYNNAYILTSSVSAINYNFTARISGLVSSITNGNFAIQFATEVAGNAVTLQIGSILKMTKVG